MPREIAYSSAVLICALLSTACGKSQAGLSVNYGTAGLETVTFNGIKLEDVSQYPQDAFHIWHMKIRDGKGLIQKGKGFDWGEVNNGRSWNSENHTWRYQFPWGEISTRLDKQANALAIHVIEKNSADSGVIVDGVSIYPLVLHFPSLPADFGNSAFEHLAVKQNDPTPSAEFDGNRIAISLDGTKGDLYRGFEPAGNGPNFYPIVSSTAMDSLSTGYPRVDRPLKPGESDSYTVRLQFSSDSSDRP